MYIFNYNRPNLIDGSTNSTQVILRLVVIGNFKCRSTEWIKKIIVVISLQVCYHRYLIHVSLAVKTKSVVSGTARRFYQNTYLLSSQSFLSTCLHESPQEYCLRTQLGLASRPHRWSSINSCPIDYAESFRGCFCLQWVRAAIRSQS